MDRTERFYKIDSLLQAHRVVPRSQMLAELEVSPATFKRDLEYMRDRLNAPIEWDREEGGYRYAVATGGQQKLPGLWFNASEAYALLMMQELLKDIQPGLLDTHIEPLQARLKAIIETGDYLAEDVERRIKVLHVATRSVPAKYFELVAGALLRKQRLHLRYFARGTGETTEREVSPQLLIHHRGNWYLAAWCHKQDAMRSFAMDSIAEAKAVAKGVKAMTQKTLDAFVGQGYGIFSGQPVKWATLQFSAERSRWIALEMWHPSQRSILGKDGRLTLEVPYSDERELLMDVMRHGQHVEILEPKELRFNIEKTLKETLKAYRQNHKDQ